VLVRRDRAEDGMNDRGEEQPGARTHEDQRRNERAVGDPRRGPGGEPGRPGRDQCHAEDHRRARAEPVGQRAAHRSEQQIVDLVLAAHHQWTGSDELQDDITLLLARRV